MLELLSSNRMYSCFGSCQLYPMRVTDGKRPWESFCPCSPRFIHPHAGRARKSVTWGENGGVCVVPGYVARPSGCAAHLRAASCRAVPLLGTHTNTACAAHRILVKASLKRDRRRRKAALSVAEERDKKGNVPGGPTPEKLKKLLRSYYTYKRLEGCNEAKGIHSLVCRSGAAAMQTSKRPRCEGMICIRQQ